MSFGVAKKPWLKHFLHLGYLTDTRTYRPYENKLDFRTVSNYFIGYFEQYRGYKFYDPTQRNIFETWTIIFFEDVVFEGRNKVRNIFLEEESVLVPNLIHIVSCNKTNLESQIDTEVLPASQDDDDIEHQGQIKILKDRTNKNTCLCGEPLEKE